MSTTTTTQDEVGNAPAEGRITDEGIAGFETPEEAVRALAMVQAYQRNQTELMEAPHADATAQTTAQAPDRAAVRKIVDEALAAGQEMLTEPQAKAVLDAYRIPVVKTVTVAADAELAAESLLGELPPGLGDLVL